MKLTRTKTIKMIEATTMMRAGHVNDEANGLEDDFMIIN